MKVRENKQANIKMTAIFQTFCKYSKAKYWRTFMSGGYYALSMRYLMSKQASPKH